MRLEGDPLQVQGDAIQHVRLYSPILNPRGLLELGQPWAKAFGLLSVVYRGFPMVKRRLGLLLAGLWLHWRGLRGLRAGRGCG